MLITWGMKELAKGRKLADVQADIHYWMKKSIPEVKDMVTEKTAGENGQSKDLRDFNVLIARLKAEGRRFEGDDDKLTDILGGEKFSFKTRMIVRDVMDILDDNPDFESLIPKELMHFFEGYIMPSKRTAMNKIAAARELVCLAKELTSLNRL